MFVTAADDNRSPDRKDVGQAGTPEAPPPRGGIHRVEPVPPSSPHLPRQRACPQARGPPQSAGRERAARSRRRAHVVLAPDAAAPAPDRPARLASRAPAPLRAVTRY